MVGRTWFLIVMFVAGLAAVAWAVYGSRLPPADFSFTGETEVATVDPALATGQPEMRIISSLFEGLGRQSEKDTHFAPGAAPGPVDCSRPRPQPDPHPVSTGSSAAILRPSHSWWTSRC